MTGKQSVLPRSLSHLQDRDPHTLANLGVDRGPSVISAKKDCSPPVFLFSPLLGLDSGA